MAVVSSAGRLSLAVETPGQGTSIIIMLRSYLYVLNHLVGLDGIQLHVAYVTFS